MQLELEIEATEEKRAEVYAFILPIYCIFIACLLAIFLILTTAILLSYVFQAVKI